MKREDILARLKFKVPESRQKRVIIHTDIRNEADDHFAILHHLLTPSEEVRGIIAGHFEHQIFPREEIARRRNCTVNEVHTEVRSDKRKLEHLPEEGTTMEKSYEEGLKLLNYAEIDNVPLLHGSRKPILDRDNLPESEGADFIIQEAMSEDARPLYVALQGCLTDLAIAYLKNPKIAEKVIAIWIGGGQYPIGGFEFNLWQDIEAARILFESPIDIWQIPVNVYKTMEVSFVEIVDKVASCGKIGAYLCEQMLEFNEFFGELILDDEWPHGESWCLGDNPTISVLLQSNQRMCWHIEKAPFIQDDLTYLPNENGKEIRVYDNIDCRMILDDFYSKMKHCYKNY